MTGSSDFALLFSACPAAPPYDFFTYPPLPRFCCSNWKTPILSRSPRFNVGLPYHLESFDFNDSYHYPGRQALRRSLFPGSICHYWSRYTISWENPSSDLTFPPSNTISVILLCIASSQKIPPAPFSKADKGRFLIANWPKPHEHWFFAWEETTPLITLF